MTTNGTYEVKLGGVIARDVTIDAESEAEALSAVDREYPGYKVRSIVKMAPTEKTLGQIAKEAYGKEFRKSESSGAAASAVRNRVIDECASLFHKEQLEVWASELVSDLGQAGHLVEAEDYEHVLDLHRRVEQFLDETVAARVRDLKSPETPA